MKHRSTLVRVIFASLLLPLFSLQASVIEAKWVPAEADYVISFDLEKLQQQPVIRDMQKSIDEGAAMAALNRELQLPPEKLTAAMFVGGGRKLRGLFIQVKVPEKELHALLMKQRGVRVENRGGRMFYLLPPLSTEKPLDQGIAISVIAPDLLFVTFDKYASYYWTALKRGYHPAFQSKIALNNAPLWVLIELQKISADEGRKKGKKAQQENVYLQLGTSVYRIWGAFLPGAGSENHGRISLEALCRDAETAQNSLFPLQMIAAIGINAIMPENPDIAAKITERMRPRVDGNSCLINMDVDQTLLQSVSSALSKQCRSEPQPSLRKAQPPSTAPRQDPKR